MYAEELGKKIMSAIDGDTRDGALRQWERLYKEKNAKKVFWDNIKHGVPKGGQKEKKMSGFGAYIFGICIPTGFRLW